MVEKRPALGRGLSALIPDSLAPAAPPGADRGLEVDTDLLRPNKFQPRTHVDDDRIEELSRSIRSHGIIQPIVVRRVGELEGRQPLDKEVLYEIIAGRYEKGAPVITSNKSLATWGDLVGDTALMMAIIDRLLHHGEGFYLRGSSYRMRGKEPVALTPSKSGEPLSSPSERA